MLALRSALVGLLFAVAALTLFPACSSAGQVSFRDYEDAFQRGMEAYEARRWDRAIEYFRATFDFGRTHERAADAQYYLASSFYGRRDYQLAAQEFTRFAETYPNDPRAETAAFRTVESYYRLSPPFELDQTDTERAIEHIRLFVARYPAAEERDRALAMQAELLEKLARKKFETGRLYERRGMYEAAGITYEDLLDRFPTSQYADQAMLGAVRAYVEFAGASIPARQPERYRRALDAYDRLVGLFPQTPHRAEADALQQRAQMEYEAAVGRLGQQATR
jgi:outer membrane protein assembly factor BamD